MNLRPFFVRLVGLALLPLGSASAANRVWSGFNAASDNWNDPLNWVGGAKPAFGDSIVFDASATPVLTNHDFAGNPQYLSLTFNAPGYGITGQTVGVTGGLSATFGVTGTITLSAPLSAVGNQAFNANGSRVTINYDNTLNLFGNTVTLDGDGTHVFNGQVSGVGLFAKTGSGRVVVNGAMPGGGSVTSFTAGRLAFNHSNMQWPVTMSGGILEGTGSIRRVNSTGGEVRPGNSSIDRLAFTEGIDLDPAVTLQIEIKTGIAATGHDQVRYTGTLSPKLDGAALSLALQPNFLLLLGQKLLLLDNQSANPISGTFAGLAEGASVTAGAVTFSISYLGGTGNDIELTVTNIAATGVTRVWSGALSNLWNTPGNWVGGTVPQPGDSVEFPAAAANKINSNNLSLGFVLNELLLTGGGYQCSGGSLAYLQGIRQAAANGAAANAVGIGIHNGAGLKLHLQSGGPLSFTPGVVNLTTAANFLHLANDSLNSTLSASGTFAGAGALSKTGVGTARLTGLSSFSGGSHVYEGTLIAASTLALGSTSTVGVDGGATLELDVPGPATFSYGLNLAGTLRTANGTGAITWQGFVALSGNPAVVTGTNAPLALNGPISGTGGLSLSGLSKVEFSGTTANTFSGPLGVSNIELALNKTAGVVAIPGSVGLSDGVLTNLQANQIVDTATVSLSSSAWNVDQETVATLELENGGVISTLPGLTLTGMIDCLPSSEISLLSGTINTPGAAFPVFVADGDVLADLRINGNIRGVGGVPPSWVKSGPGLLHFAEAEIIGSAHLIEPLRIDEGEVQFEDLPEDNSVFGPVVQLNGGTLSGSGKVRGISALANGGSILPGASPGILQTGSLSWNSGVFMTCEITGTVPGVDHDQLSVNGTVALGGASLSLDVNIGAPKAGDVFVLISNDGTDAVSGEFAGLPDNSIVSAGGLPLLIDYQGGDGNDVSLVVAPSTRTWDGGGANNLWTNPANWLGDVAPIPGDILVFPAVASQYNTLNDFPEATAFEKYLLSGAGYRLNGNHVFLQKGITQAVPGSNEVQQRITLGQDQTWQVASGGELSVAGAALPSLVLGGRTLTFAGNGNIRIDHQIDGLGALIKQDTGELVLTANNSFQGPVEILGGVLSALHAQALGPGVSSTRVFPNAELKLDALGGVWATEPLLLGGHLRVRSGLEWNGPVSLIDSSATISVATSTFKITSNIAGAFALTKGGDGELWLTANNSYAGPTAVTAGVLRIDGDQGAQTVNLASGTHLAGFGTVNKIGGSGALAPGWFNLPGILSALGPVQFQGLKIDIKGPAVGSEYDRLAVSGDVTLSGPLVLQGTHVPAYGEVFTVIGNEGIHAVSGTFSNVSPSGTIVFNGALLEVDYTAGSQGLDVSLTRVHPPAPSLTSESASSNASSTQASFTGKGIPGVAYQLQISSDLVNWTPTQSAIADLNGDFVLGENLAVPLIRRFYRVVGQ